MIEAKHLSIILRSNAAASLKTHITEYLFISQVLKIIKIKEKYKDKYGMKSLKNSVFSGRLLQFWNSFTNNWLINWYSFGCLFIDLKLFLQDQHPLKPLSKKFLNLK